MYMKLFSPNAKFIPLASYPQADADSGEMPAILGIYCIYVIQYNSIKNVYQIVLAWRKVYAPASYPQADADSGDKPSALAYI